MVAVDATDTLYVANESSNNILEFASGASGNAAATRTISGAGTGLNQPEALAIDAAGTLYVPNEVGDTVTRYAAGATGNATPTATISGAATGLNQPEGIAVQAIPAVATTTTVASSNNPSSVGQSVTFTATVSPKPGTGTVSFTDNGSAITGCGVVAVGLTTGTATCTVTYSAAGTHNIVAAYSGNAGFQASTSAVLVQSVAAAGVVPVPATGAAAPAERGPVSPWPLALIVAGLGLLGWSRREGRISGG